MKSEKTYQDVIADINHVFAVNEISNEEAIIIAALIHQALVEREWSAISPRSVEPKGI